MRDPKILRELAYLCRPLVIILCVGYCINVIFLVAAMAGSPNRRIVESAIGTPLHKIYVTSEINFGIILALSFVAALTCALFITSTYIKNMWLAIPYIVVHILLMIYTLALFCLSLMFVNNYQFQYLETEFERFGFYIVHFNGAFTVFLTLICFSLQLYVFIPLWKFLIESKLVRAEKIEAGRRVGPGSSVRSLPAGSVPQLARSPRSPIKQEDEDEDRGAPLLGPRRSISYDRYRDRDRRRSRHGY